MRVGIQGDVGSFSEEAARRLLGNEISVVGFRRFEDVFAAVARRELDGCVVPLENSIAGSVHTNYDLMLKYHFRICREYYLRVCHHLIVFPGVDLKDIRTVISHPVALAQCERFLGMHPEWEVVATYDTSGSVREVMEKNLRDCAAIAGRRAAECFGGEILVSNIQDSVENYTRFVFLRLEPTGETGDKVSLVFRLANVPGTLFRALGVFAQRGVNLLKIESRPLKDRPWEYLFYVDLSGGLGEDKVAEAVEELQGVCEYIEVLGCYSGIGMMDTGEGRL